MNIKKVRLNAPLRRRPAGSVVDVVFKNGIAVDPYWRARLLDATRDNCVEIVKDPPAKHRETKVTGPDETKTPEKTRDKKG